MNTTFFSSALPYLRRLIFAILMGSVAPAVFADASMKIDWLGDSEIRDLLESEAVFDDGISFINQTFQLQRSLTLQMGADDGPLYDPQADVIQIPYEFYQQVISLFEEIVPDDEEARKGYAIDSMLHTLFHEFGHAVIDQFDIPVVGREEDAVDALASVLMIEYFDDGADMAISAAELFALESEDRGSLQEQDFWDEHSLDEQRYYTTLCHVFGSDPENYESLADEAGFTSERAEACVFEYQQLVADWDKLLVPARM